MNTQDLITEKESILDFDTTVETLTQAAERFDWKVPAIHNLQESLAKAEKYVLPVKVIEICKPEFSGKMLEKDSERIVSVMMPCRISVYQKSDGKTYVSAINAAILAAAMPDSVKEGMMQAADQVDQIIHTVIH